MQIIPDSFIFVNYPIAGFDDMFDSSNATKQCY